MRFVLLTLLVGLLTAAAGAVTIEVPNYEQGIRAIQQAVDLAAPGDTVLVMSGTYDSVRSFETPLGRRDAVVSISSDIVLLGKNRSGVKIDHSQATYGILVQNVSEDALVSNLTILGGASRDKGLLDDGDGRLLSAGICCVDAASPTIRDVDIENGATGIIIRTETGSADSAPVIEGVVVARGSHHGIFIFENGSTPVTIDRCTLVANFDYGIYVSGGSVEVTSSALTNNGKNGIYGYLATPSVRYCNVYWNDRMFPDEQTGPLNYGGSLGDLTGVDGNISMEPYYCDFYGSAGYDYHVCLDTEPSPHILAGEGGVTIGALPAACSGCQSSPVEASSWGAIKALYRN
ncbi:MAG: right-handed parallel beta-helix repeat-containing protein [Candidatus Eisenbacteria bacterium]